MFLQQLELFPFNTSKEFDGDCSFCRGIAIQPMVVTDAERFFPQYAQNSHDWVSYHVYICLFWEITVPKLLWNQMAIERESARETYVHFELLWHTIHTYYYTYTKYYIYIYIYVIICSIYIFIWLLFFILLLLLLLLWLLSLSTQEAFFWFSNKQPLAATCPGANGCKWLQVAAGTKWLQVAAGTKWLQVAAIGCWDQVAASGCNWLLGPSGCKCASGCNWLLGPSGCKWLQLAAGTKWLQVAAGTKWLQVAASAGNTGEFSTFSGGRHRRILNILRWTAPENSQHSPVGASGCKWLPGASGCKWLQVAVRSQPDLAIIWDATV